MMPVVLDYPDRDLLMTDLAEIVAGELADAVVARGQATLAVPGGTTPGPFLEALSRADLEWSKVKVMLTDERFVPETSERSNTALLRRSLLQNAAQSAQLIPFYVAGDTPEDVLDGLARAVSDALPIDSCILGMGTDMHTASIFPGADKLDLALSPDAPVLVPMRAPGAPEPRITLPAHVLKNARNIHVLIVGEAKKSALGEAFEANSALEAPIRAIFDALSPVNVHYAA